MSLLFILWETLTMQKIVIQVMQKMPDTEDKTSQYLHSSSPGSSQNTDATGSTTAQWWESKLRRKKKLSM
jgi:hypothetical protein